MVKSKSVKLLHKYRRYYYLLFICRYDSDFLSESIEATNDFYGALKPQTKNVLYVHGSIDPWHALGLVNSTNSALPTIYIEGESKKH